MHATLTPVYGAVLALLFLVLSVRTLRLRGRLRIAVGDAGNEAMLRAMRVHANFAEYVPLTLLLIWFVELAGGVAWVHALCAALLAGRIVHAYGVSRSAEPLRYRVLGMTMTFFALLGAASTILVTAVRRMGDG